MPMDIEMDYLAAINNTAPGLLQQADKIAVPGEDWISSVSRAITTVAMADHQRKLLDIQLDRARRGQPPLDSSQFGLGVSVGVSPQIMYLGLAALVVLYLVLRKR